MPLAFTTSSECFRILRRTRFIIIWKPAKKRSLKKPRSSASFSTSSSQSPPTMAPSSLFPGPYGSHPQSLPPPTAAPVQDINQFGDYGSYCMLLPPPTPSSFNHQPYLTLAVSASSILFSSPHHSLFSRFAIRSGFLNLIFFFYPNKNLTTIQQQSQQQSLYISKPHDAKVVLVRQINLQ